MESLLTAAPAKSQMVADHIVAEIRAGKLTPGARMYGMRELASRFQVSFTAVNHAYNILEDKKMIVRKARSGTFVNPALKHCGTIMLGLLTSYGRDDIENYYEPLFSIAAEKRVIPMVGVIKKSSNWQQTIQDILAREPDGLLIDVEAKLVPLEELKKLTSSIQVCYCNRWEWSSENPEIAVLTDYSGAYGEALVFLRERGHRRIILLEDHFCPEPFLNKYMEIAMEFAGLAYGKDVLRISKQQLLNDTAAVYAAIKCFNPTALFAHSDYSIHIMTEKCPCTAKLEKIGFFNLEYSRIPQSEFSSFGIDFGEIWRKAIMNFDNPKAQIQYVKPKLILK